MIDFNRPTGEIVREIEAAARAAGIPTESKERWEGDGVFLIWSPGRRPYVHVGGNDTGMDPGATLSYGDGGAPGPDLRTADEILEAIR